MPDRSTENLERIRACDAGWNENDHPRANNGQFTSGGGGGAKVSKLPEGKTTAHNSIKAGQIAKNQERYDSAHKSMAALYLSDLTNALKKGDYESAREHLDSHERDKKYYDRLTAKNNKFKAAKATLEKARPGIQKMRQAKAAGGATHGPRYHEAQKQVERFDFTPGSEEFNASFGDAKEKLKKWQGILKKDPTDKTSKNQVDWYQGLVDAYKKIAEK